MDINALKLKTKNMAKKIENATRYIEEIDKHKKSIFEFWKYSNKDEMATLPEGEQEEINVIKKIEKIFDYEEDFEEFGEKLDKIQRGNLNREDTDALFIATTEIIDVLNKIRADDISEDELENSLKKLKEEARDLKTLDEEEYDIFGNMIEDSTKLKKINNKKHRELAKDKFSILDINKNTRLTTYKITLQIMLLNILKALEKGIIPENVPVYKTIDSEILNNKELNIFDMNLENEIKNVKTYSESKVDLYKLNIKEGTKGIGFTNIIFYDNKNRTLPIGMNLSTKMLVDISKLNLKLVNQKCFKVISTENEDDDFSDIDIKDVEVFEYDMIDSQNA